jgi:hypothetical protein
MIKIAVSIGLVLAPPLLVVLTGNPDKMNTALIAGVIAALLVHIEKLKSIKATPEGVEAEFQEAIQNAYTTIDIVKRLTRTLVLSSIHTLNRIGRIGVMDGENKHQVRDELIKIASELNLIDTDFDNVMETFTRYHTWDHFQLFKESFLANQPGGNPVIYERLTNLRKDYFDTTNYPTEEEIRKACGGIYDSLHADQRDLLEDYYHYVRHQSLRRPEALSYG